MKRINTHEAKTRLSELLLHVQEEQTSYLICRNGEPVAELKPLDPPVADRLKVHPDLKPLWVSDDFDPVAPLSEQEWPTDSQ